MRFAPWLFVFWAACTTVEIEGVGCCPCAEESTRSDRTGPDISNGGSGDTNRCEIIIRPPNFPLLSTTWAIGTGVGDTDVVLRPLTVRAEAGKSLLSVQKTGGGSYTLIAPQKYRIDVVGLAHGSTARSAYIRRLNEPVTSRVQIVVTPYTYATGSDGYAELDAMGRYSTGTASIRLQREQLGVQIDFTEPSP